MAYQVATLCVWGLASFATFALTVAAVFGRHGDAAVGIVAPVFVIAFAADRIVHAVEKIADGRMPPRETFES